MNIADDVDGGSPKIQTTRSINSIRVGLKSPLHEKRIKVAPTTNEEEERCNTVESDQESMKTKMISKQKRRLRKIFMLDRRSMTDVIEEPDQVNSLFEIARRLDLAKLI